MAQFYYSFTIHSPWKLNSPQARLAFLKSYFSDKGLATILHLPIAAVCLLRLNTLHQISCRCVVHFMCSAVAFSATGAGHLLVNFHLVCLYKTVIFLKHRVTVSCTHWIWLIVSFVAFAAVPVIVKTLSPLFLILLFFMLRIQFPASWRTIECSHGSHVQISRYKHWYNEKKGASMCQIYCPGCDPSVVMLHLHFCDNTEYRIFLLY